MESDKNSRRLRKRKYKKRYSDNWTCDYVTGDGDDIDNEGTSDKGFNIKEKLIDYKFLRKVFVKEINGHDFNVNYLKVNGFNLPLLFRVTDGLGIKMPDKSFTIRDIRSYVGSKRIIDVIDVETQKNIDMTMKQFQKYYDNPRRSKLLNVISLEFSHTKLDSLVVSPKIVREVDWVDNVWPKYLKIKQKNSTNLLDEMYYPKVQKYVLMSVKNCYTDFHIDFGGSSVWYHILKGEKIFWLIPPTDENLKLYKNWVLSGKQSDIFFGDLVEDCQRITLYSGSTFFIPSGWIHAVFTPKDSLVFGGNFLHSFNIEKQIEVVKIEDNIRINNKFRFPFFNEILWYVLVKYIENYFNISLLKDYGILNDSNADNNFVNYSNIFRNKFLSLNNDLFKFITPDILNGIRLIVCYLQKKPLDKSIPHLIKDPCTVISFIKKFISIYENRFDNKVEGDDNYSIFVNKSKMNESNKKYLKTLAVRKQKNVSSDENCNFNTNLKKNKLRQRRTRCRTCAACTLVDCGNCCYCKSMIKFGGSGTAKQSCILRQCLRPKLPNSTACIVCDSREYLNNDIKSFLNNENYYNYPVSKISGRNTENVKLKYDTLMECSICYEVIHPFCFIKKHPEIIIKFDIEYVNNDLPNSWKCPRCYQYCDGTKLKPRHFKAREKLSSLNIDSDNIDDFTIGKYYEMYVDNKKFDERGEISSIKIGNNSNNDSNKVSGNDIFNNSYKTCSGSKEQVFNKNSSDEVITVVNNTDVNDTKITGVKIEMGFHDNYDNDYHNRNFSGSYGKLSESMEIDSLNP